MINENESLAHEVAEKIMKNKKDRKFVLIIFGFCLVVISIGYAVRAAACGNISITDFFK